MASIRWSPQASREFIEILNYIGKDIIAVEKLAKYNRIGRIVPETNDPSIRELIFKSYRIIYRIKEDLIEIISIFHGSRTLKLD